MPIHPFRETSGAQAWKLKACLVVSKAPPGFEHIIITAELIPEKRILHR